MITGTPIENPEEHFEEPSPEEMYQNRLVMFEGVENIWYGVTDELRDLSGVIESIGESVIQKEKEFAAIYREETKEEGSYISDKLLESWHMREYRQFSYRSLLLLVQSVFEKGISELHYILVDEKRIDDERPFIGNKRSDKLIDYIKSLKQLGVSLDPYIGKVHGFSFIRNKLGHTNGYYNQADKYYSNFEELVKKRNDISWGEAGRVGFDHRLQISRSTLIKDYLALVREIITELVRAASSKKLVA